MLVTTFGGSILKKLEVGGLKGRAKLQECFRNTKQVLGSFVTL
jgi:hypothetical protein